MNQYQSDLNVQGKYVFSQEQRPILGQPNQRTEMVFFNNTPFDQNHIENNNLRTEQLLKEEISQNELTNLIFESNNKFAAMKSEDDKKNDYSELLLRYTRQSNKYMQENPQQDQANRFASTHVSPQKFSTQNLSPLMSNTHNVNLKKNQLKQLQQEPNIFLQENINFNADLPRQSSYERNGYQLDGQDPLFKGCSLSKQGGFEPSSLFQNDLQNQAAAKFSSALEINQTYFTTNTSPYMQRANELSKTSLHVLHDGFGENKGEVNASGQEIKSLNRFYSSEQTFYNPSQSENNIFNKSNKQSREPSSHIQNIPQNSKVVAQVTDNSSMNSGSKSGGNLLNFQRFATRNIKNQFHDHKNLSGQNSPYAIGSPSGKKTKMINLGIPREPASMQNLGGKIENKIESINEKRGRTVEEKHVKIQNNGINKVHSISELDIIQERRKIQMEEQSQLQQTASSQNEQPNITAQSDSIIPSNRQPKALSNSCWSLQRLHAFVKENKNYSNIELNKIDHGKMILTYQDSFSDQTFFKSLTLMYFQNLFLKDPQLGNSSQLTLFDLLNFVNKDHIILHSVPLKDTQGEQLKEIFIKNVNELANLRTTLSQEALFEKFLQLFTSDPLFCEALLQVLKQSVALTCESSFKEQASSFLQIASQNWFDIKTEFFPLISNAFNFVIEMHYLLDNQIEISTFQSLRAQTAQPSTLSFVYYYNQSLKKQFYLPLFSLEDSVIYGTLSSFFRHSPSPNFLSQLTQNSVLSKSESLKRFNDPNNQNEMKEQLQKGNNIGQTFQDYNIQTKENNLQLAIESPTFQYSQQQDKLDENYQGKQGNSTPQNQDSNQTNQQTQLNVIAQQYTRPFMAQQEIASNLNQKDNTIEIQLPSLILPQKVTDISPSHFPSNENFSAVYQGIEYIKELATIASPTVKLYQNLEQIPQQEFNSKFLASKIQLLLQICNENTEKIEKTIQIKEDKLHPGISEIRSQQDKKKMQQNNLANLLQSKNMYYPQTNVNNYDIEHRNRGNSAPRVQHFNPSVLQGVPPNRTGSPPPPLKRKDQHQLVGQSSNQNKNIPSVSTTPAKWQTQYQRFEDAVVSTQQQQDFTGVKKQNSFQGQNSINRYGQVQTSQGTPVQYKYNQPQQIHQQNTQKQIGYNLSFGNNINSTNRYQLQKHHSLLQQQYPYPIANNYNGLTNQQQQNAQISSINSQLFSNKPQTVKPSMIQPDSKQLVPLLGIHQQQQYLGTQNQQNHYFRRNY